MRRGMSTLETFSLLTSSQPPGTRRRLDSIIRCQWWKHSSKCGAAWSPLKRRRVPRIESMWRGEHGVEQALERVWFASSTAARSEWHALDWVPRAGLIQPAKREVTSRDSDHWHGRPNRPSQTTATPMKHHERSKSVDHGPAGQAEHAIDSDVF